jgi:secreted trypsin-like serine protease
MKTCLILFVALCLVNSTVGIHDGSQATKHQFPYVVYVRSPQFYCSGTLISDRHVMTAAHCLMSLKQGNKAKIILGMHTNHGWGSSDGIDDYSSKFWIHENFSMPLAMFDIGIVELTKPINELVNNTHKAKPIGISTKVDAELDLDDDEIIVAGWGYVRKYTPAYKLQYTKMKLINMTECIKYQSHYIETITKDHICTEKTAGMVCDGDSGAALVSTKTGKIIGIASFIKDAENGVDMHYNDCKSKIPVVSTRVSSYIDWISAKTGIDFNKPEKVCKVEGVINAQNINQLNDCEIIDGNIEITADNSYESLKVLATVRRITGFLKVHSKNLTNLSFLENLEFIHNAKNSDYGLHIRDVIILCDLMSIAINNFLFIFTDVTKITRLEITRKNQQWSNFNSLEQKIMFC